MLKENVSLLHKHDEHLLGEKLRNHIADTIKFVTQTKQIFTGYKKRLLLRHSSVRRQSEEQKFFLTKNGSKNFHNSNQQQQHRHTNYEQTGSQQQRHGRYNCST